ncbi:MAG: metal-dependent hydrolase [Nanoarchaeota archaeon]
MRAGTHVVFAFLAGLLALFVWQPSLHMIIFFALLSFFALLPDIDYAKSTIGRHAKLVGFFVGHRGIFHSLFALAGFGILAYVIGKVYVFPVVLGYASHLLLDSLNTAGIVPFHPFGKKIRGPIKIGSLGEILLFVVFLCLASFLVLLRYGSG